MPRPHKPPINSTKGDACRVDARRIIGSKVSLNIYELNPVLEVLNRFVLRKNQMGIFHCGVEIHSLEYSFVMTFDSCETGVRHNTPKQCPSYKFCESIGVGWTDLSAEGTQNLVSTLAGRWPAHSYHISRRNCLHFAETLVDELGLCQQFPEWLKSVSEVVTKSSVMASVVDSFWMWAKWLLTKEDAASDSRSCRCCPTMNFTCGSCQQHLSRHQVVKGCEARETALREDIVNTKEASVCVNSCEYDARSLCNSGCLSRSKSDTSFCGVSLCDDGSRCVVHSFTRIGFGRSEVYFEFVQTPGQPAEEPKHSRLLWDGGSSTAVSQTVMRTYTRHACTTLAGILLYEGVPDEMLDGDKEIEFQYGSFKGNSIRLRATQTEFCGSFTA